MVRALKERLDEMSSAQQGASGLDVDHGESFAAGDAPGVPAAEYLGGRVEGVTERRTAGIQGSSRPTPPGGTTEWWEKVEVFGSGPDIGDARMSFGVGSKGVRVRAGLRLNGFEAKFPA